MPRPWIRRGVDRVIETPIFDLERHHLRTPHETEHAFHILKCPDWCNILPITPDGLVVMVRQYRYGTDEETLELPGGMIDPEDPNPMDGARRELLEGAPGTTVMGVASSLGFGTSPGRFSLQYRQRFSESPSDTLAAARARNG